MSNVQVKSRHEFIDHVTHLINDFKTNGHEWENVTIPAYLEALAAWLSDCDGYYRNARLVVDVDEPSWRLFADALQAAAVYE